MRWNSLEEAFASVLERGELISSWIVEYESFLRQCDRSLLSGFDWSVEAFQVCHGVILYLPLRYRAYRGFGRKRKETTESVIAELRSRTESFMWATAAKSPCKKDESFFGDASVKDPARRLPRLVLGIESPVTSDLRIVNGCAWRDAYIEAAEGFCDLYQSQSSWPRWTCLALHFASTCIELVTQRRIDANRFAQLNGGTIDTTPLLTPAVIADGPRFLLHNWLIWSKLPVESTGMPEVGIRDNSNKRCSVRTVSEKAILYPVVKRSANRL